jgi:hypothetical protein
MTIFQRIRKSRYHLLSTVLPIVILVAALKTAAHFLHLEVISKEITMFFPSILTGIIFILGFLLAGVVADYKESEKFPSDIAASLYTLWQEAEFLQKVNNSKTSEILMNKIKEFVPLLKYDFFVLQNDKIFELLDRISDDIVQYGKEGVIVNVTVRLKTEVSNLKKIIYRISVIKNTDFIPSVYTSIRVIAIVFLGVTCLLSITPWWVGLIEVAIFTTIIFTILYLIKDMDDPFEYDGTDDVKSDEVSLEVLDHLQGEFKKN